MTGTKQDEVFFFENSIFLVEDTLFKIPRISLERTSVAFGSMFSLPTGSGDTEQEGSSSENPIRLEGIKKIDFQRLLWVMFPDLSKYSKAPLTMGKNDWVSVLKLSTLWAMGELRRQAIAKLSQITIDPMDKVFLAREYKVEDWLVEAYTELVKRERALSKEESKTLGWGTAIQIYKAREETFKLGMKGGPSGQWQCQYCSRQNANNAAQAHERVYTSLGSTICEAFEDELKDVKYEEE